MELITAAAHHRWAVRPGEWYGLRYLRRSIPDPEMRQALTPDFALGCKRVLLANGFYRALRQPNVELLPVAAGEIRERSVVGTDGREREVDTIIFGTGFHITDLPIAERVRGRSGRTLAETWDGSPEAYLGTTVVGFPNAFLLFGPNIGVASAFAIIEAQMHYLVDALRTMDRAGAVAVDVRRDVQAAYNERVQDALQGSVWNAGGCSSYYLDRNGRNSTIWPWAVGTLGRRLRRFDLDAYRVEQPRPMRQPA
jgi:cyclohexanone monooxygenase